ncbi:hypothetical protein FQN54_000577 [Arachnomyces sp. PD_36]|nr:hypothetical protein FQN54_000577 [Arachnomyces sp. PD_36]
MSLILLPQELLLIIVEPLPEQILNSLARTCRHLYASLNPVLYNRGLLPNSDYPSRSSTESSRTRPAVFCAAAKGNVGAVRKFITEFGVDVNARLPGSLLTLLHCGASYCHPSLVKFLLENGASLSVKDQPTTTALQRGVQNNDPETVTYVLEYGPDACDVVKAVSEISRGPVSSRIMAPIRTHILNKLGRKFLDTPGSEVAMHRLLLHAIGSNDEKAVKELLDWGVPACFLPQGRANRSMIVYCTDGRQLIMARDYIPDGKFVISALFHAVLVGHLEIAQLLHDYGAPVEGEELALPVMFAAVWSGNVEATRLLIEWGANSMVRLEDGTGTTLLQIAAGDDFFDFPSLGSPNSLEMMKLLLDSGVPVDYPNYAGDNALHSAVRNNWVAGVRFLLENGAHVKMVSDGPALLHLALSEELDDIALILLEHNADVAAKENSSSEPLMCVVQTVGIASVLAKRGCDIHARDSDGYMGLDHAVLHGDLELVEFFLQHGASPHRVKVKGPLHRASQWSGELEMFPIIQCLLKHGAPVNARDNSGTTPLGYALSRGDSQQVTKVVYLLLENGADLHSYDEEGRSDFHRAVHWRSTFVLPAVLKYVIDINQRTIDGNSSLHLATSSGDAESVWMLLDHGADPNMKNMNGEAPLVSAVVSGYLAEATHLLDYGADPMGRVEGGQTMLHYAIMDENMEMVSLLVKHMQFFDDKTPNGQTALHLAVGLSNKQCAQLLVEAGASLNVVNDLGETPLQHARRLLAQGRNCGEVAQYLETAAQQKLNP